MPMPPVVSAMVTVVAGERRRARNGKPHDAAPTTWLPPLLRLF